jgi:hypothetical protein
MSLREIYEQVVAEGNSPAQCENQAMALRRYAEQVLGVTDPDALLEFFNEAYALLNDGTPFDEDEDDGEDEDDEEN